MQVFGVDEDGSLIDWIKHTGQCHPIRSGMLPSMAKDSGCGRVRFGIRSNRSTDVVHALASFQVNLSEG